MNGDIQKKKVTKKDARELRTIEESGMSYVDVGKDIGYNKKGTKCLVVKKLTKDRFGTELSLQELKEMGIKKEGFSKFLTGFKEYKADVIKQQLLDSKQNAQIRIKVSKDMLKKNPEDVMTKKISSQMIRDAEKQLKDLDAALKDIDIYKAMKEKTGVASHASGGLAGMLGE